MIKIMKITVFLLIFTGVGLSAGILFHASGLIEITNNLKPLQTENKLNTSKDSPLVIGDQMNVPTFYKDSSIQPDKLIFNAGIEVSGGTQPYFYDGEVDTSTVGQGFETPITISDSSSPTKIKIKIVKYNVENEQMTATPQTKTPTYFQTEEVTADKIFEDAGVTVSGGTAPYTYTGAVDTSVVGGNFITSVIVTDKLNQAISVNIEYDVEEIQPLILSKPDKEPTYYLGEIVSANQALEDAGIEISGGYPPYRNNGILLDTSIIKEDSSAVMQISDRANQSQIAVVFYNVVSALEIGKQTDIPRYDQGESVTIEKLLTDAGITVSGGVYPYSYLGNVDTTVEGDNLETQITIQDSSYPLHSKKIGIKYNVGNSTPLVVSDQKNTPTYNLGESVTPEEVIKDSEVDVSGGVEPYSYLGAGDVDTTVVGNELETTVTIEDSSNPMQREDTVITYNVENPLTVSDQKFIPTYELNEAVTPRNLIMDAEVDVSGGVEPYSYLGVGNVDTTVVGNGFQSEVTVQDSSDPVQREEAIITYNVKSLPVVIEEKKNQEEV